MTTSGSPIADSLFTAQSIMGVGSATLAVTVVSNALYKLAQLPQRWTGFVAACVISYVVVAMSTSPAWYDWLLAFINACLLYCSALGMNEVGVATTSQQGRGFARTEGFFTSWFARPSSKG